MKKMKSATMRRRLSQEDFWHERFTRLAAAKKGGDAYVDPRTTFRKSSKSMWPTGQGGGGRKERHLRPCLRGQAARARPDTRAAGCALARWPSRNSIWFRRRMRGRHRAGSCLRAVFGPRHVTQVQPAGQTGWPSFGNPVALLGRCRAGTFEVIEAKVNPGVSLSPPGGGPHDVTRVRSFEGWGSWKKK